MITKVRKARQCDDPNQVLVNGICEDARHVSRAQHVCVAWNEGFCIEWDAKALRPGSSVLAVCDANGHLNRSGLIGGSNP
jgi:hypothetical protein